MRQLVWKIRELFGRSKLRGGRKAWRQPAGILLLESLERRSLPTGTASGVLNGVAFIDADRDGNHDSTEIIVRGISVHLAGTTNQGADVTVDATTDANGAYAFQNVLPGTYEVTAEPGENQQGEAIVVSGIAVAGGQTVTHDFGLSGLTAQAISLRQFLTTTTLDDYPFADAGAGEALANDRENNLPTLRDDSTTIDVVKNSDATTIDLSGVFNDPDLSTSQVVFHTTQGDINVELFDAQTPQTVANFYNYILDDRYDDTIFHRLVSGFVAQGGGFVRDDATSQLSSVETDPAVESEPVFSNVAGTIAMAKLGSDPNSATSQFFFNLADNTSNLDSQNGGFTVFGQIVSDTDQTALNAIASLTTQDQSATNGAFTDIPLVNYAGTDFPNDAAGENYVLVNDVEVVRRDEFLTYSLLSLINSNEGLVTASIENNRLMLSYAAGQVGTAALTIRATDRLGATLDVTFNIIVADQAPVATVEISPLAPASDAVLTATATVFDADDDPTMLTYVWRINDEVVRTNAGTTELTDSLDLSTLADLEAGDQVTVEVTPNDGTTDGATATATTAINRAPVVDSLLLTPSAPTTNAILTATASVSDADGDAIALTYLWKVNGVIVQSTLASSSLTSTLNLSELGYGDRGDEVTVEVTPSDGKNNGTTVSSSITIVDIAPVVDSVIIAPTAPLPSSTLTAIAMVSDADNDAITLTYVWKINGAEAQTTTGSTSLTDMLDLSTFDTLQPGDVITIEATPTAVGIAGATATASITVNRAPVVESVLLTPSDPASNQTVTATVSATDADNDSLTLTYVWKVNGNVVQTTDSVNFTDTLALSLTGQGDAGDVITVEVTANDGKQIGGTATATTTVVNTAPEVAFISLTPTAPLPSEFLIAAVSASDPDNDPVTLTYVWKRNGEVVQTTTETASVTDTLDLNTISGLTSGDEITVEVTPHAGGVDGVTETASTTINRAPTVDSVALTPSELTTTQTVTATAVASDLDNDSLTLTYVWKVNGNIVQTTANVSSLTDTLNLSVAGQGDLGDAITVEVTASDGKQTSATANTSTIIVNAAPVVESLSLTPSVPLLTDTLTATVVVSDPDNDPVTLTYVWKVNGGVVQTTIGAGLTDTLAFGLLSGRGPGDEITVEVTPTDGDDGVTATASVFVNRAPVIDSVSLTPADPTTNQTLTATVATSDPENDGVTLTYVWKVNGSVVQTTANSSSRTDTLDLSVSSQVNEGDQVTVEVTPNDGHASGAAATATTVVVNSQPVISSLSLTPEAPQTTDTLIATVIVSDDDADSLTLTYVWKHNGEIVQSTTVSAGLTTDTLDLATIGGVTAGDEITVEVTPHDGTINGSTVTAIVRVV